MRRHRQRDAGGLSQKVEERRCLQGRNGTECANRNGQRQKTHDEDCKLTHGALQMKVLRCSARLQSRNAPGRAGRRTIFALALLPKQIQMARQNADQINWSAVVQRRQAPSGTSTSRSACARARFKPSASKGMQ